MNCDKERNVCSVNCYRLLSTYCGGVPGCWFKITWHGMNHLKPEQPSQKTHLFNRIGWLNISSLFSIKLTLEVGPDAPMPKPCALVTSVRASPVSRICWSLFSSFIFVQSAFFFGPEYIFYGLFSPLVVFVCRVFLSYVLRVLSQTVTVVSNWFNYWPTKHTQTPISWLVVLSVMILLPGCFHRFSLGRLWWWWRSVVEEPQGRPRFCAKTPR